MFDLNDKVAVVTGGSRGIGRATSLQLARAGAFVVVNYRSRRDAAESVLEEIRAAGGDGQALGFDVADGDAAYDAIAGVAKERGRLDILVNNAGIARDQLLARVKSDDLDEAWSTNVNGAFFCAKAAIRSMMRARTGRIINLTSVVGEMGNPGQSVYSASKAGLIGLTKTLAREYAPRGITVNAISPGYIDTDMTDSLNDTQREWIVSQTPLGRVGAPADVAAAVLFLASDEASYITGQIIRVNGGMYM